MAIPSGLKKSKQYPDEKEKPFIINDLMDEFNEANLLERSIAIKVKAQVCQNRSYR